METSSRPTPKEVITEDGPILLQKLEIWMPMQMVRRITAFLHTGLYGRTLEEASERLIAERLLQMEPMVEKIYGRTSYRPGCADAEDVRRTPWNQIPPGA